MQLKSGWLDKVGFYSWMAKEGVHEHRKLSRDNQTDGEAHRQFIHKPSGKTFDFNGNWYDAESWMSLKCWVEATAKSE